MSDKSKSKSPTMSGATFDTKDLRAAIKTQTENALRTQAALLDSFELFTDSWLDRRRAANQSTLETWTRICDCDDPAEASAAYNEWVSGSIDRMVTGSRIASEQTMRMFQQMMELLEPDAAAKKSNVTDIARKETPAQEPEKATRVAQRVAS